MRHVFHVIMSLTQNRFFFKSGQGRLSRVPLHWKSYTTHLQMTYLILSSTASPSKPLLQQEHLAITPIIGLCPTAKGLRELWIFSYYWVVSILYLNGNGTMAGLTSLFESVSLLKKKKWEYNNEDIQYLPLKWNFAYKVPDQYLAHAKFSINVAYYHCFRIVYILFYNILLIININH